MKSLTGAFVLLSSVFAASALAQVPTIAAVENNYSYVLPGLPNYGIAQGSILVIFGSNLASSATGLQGVPLKTTLNGVSARATVSGTSKDILLYYVTPTQVAGILPSSTPTGTGTMTVTNNGQTSAPAPITVVQSAFGTLTLNGAGTGPAAAFDVRSNYLGPTNAANPGEFVTLWGSGVGPVTGDETIAQTPANLTNVPISASVGGVSATVQYHGRSIYPGLDQINIVVPAGVSGCYVSVIIRSANIISNITTIPVAASGRICSDQITGFTSTDIQNLLNKPNFTIGSIGIGKGTVTTPPITIAGFTLPGSTTTTDSGYASFVRYTSAQFSAATLTSGAGQVSSIGSCQLYTFNSNNATVPNIQFTLLNAGPQINVTGPNGSKAMPFQQGGYFATLGGGTGTTALPIFIPSTGGTFSFNNGSGGPDIGGFTTQISLASPLVWSNMNSITTINRNQGVTVTWTGGDPNSYVTISGTSISFGGTSANPTVLGASFTCTAPVTPASFTVPAEVLLALPPSSGQTVNGVTVPGGSSLSVGNYTNPVKFTAPNLDLGFVSAYVSSTTSAVTYQ